MQLTYSQCSWTTWKAQKDNCPSVFFAVSTKSLWLSSTHSTGQQTIPNNRDCHSNSTRLYSASDHNNSLDYCFLIILCVKSKHISQFRLSTRYYTTVVARLGNWDRHSTALSASIFVCIAVNLEPGSRISHWVQQSIQLSWEQPAKSIHWQLVIKITILHHHQVDDINVIVMKII